MLRANAAHALGDDLALFGDELAEFGYVLVVDLLCLVYAEVADLLARDSLDGSFDRGFFFAPFLYLL